MPALTAGAVILVLLLGACAERAPTPSLAVSFDALVEDPDSYAAVRVRVEAAYLSDRQVSVATARLVGDPPRPADPTVWVEGPAPEGPCVRSATGVASVEVADVSGVFQYAPAGGLGRDGEWTMALEEATVRCPGEDQFDPGS